MRRENEKDQALVTEVKQKLDWYINDASDKEYDEKAVASLEYLLETLEPTDDFKVDEEKAWVEFKDYVAQREAHDGAKRDKTPKTQKHPAFWSRHKGLVAAAILVLILAVSISTSSEAVRDNGFFHWIKEMVGGREMITVPEDIGDTVESEPSVIIRDRSEIPEEWREWSEIEQDVMSEEEFEWNCLEIVRYPRRTVVKSHYDYQQTRLIIGMLVYADETMKETEIFDRFSEYKKWVLEGEEYEVNSVEDDMGVFYSVEFFYGNSKYFITGQEEIVEKIKELIINYKKKSNEFKISGLGIKNRN